MSILFYEKMDFFDIRYDIEKVAEKIKADKGKGKEFSIVAVSEGAKSLDGKQVVAKIIEDSGASFLTIQSRLLVPLPYPLI